MFQSEMPQARTNFFYYPHSQMFIQNKRPGAGISNGSGMLKPNITSCHLKLKCYWIIVHGCLKKFQFSMTSPNDIYKYRVAKCQKL